MRMLDCLDPLLKDDMDSRYEYITLSAIEVAHDIAKVPTRAIVWIGRRPENILQCLRPEEISSP